MEYSGVNNYPNSPKARDASPFRKFNETQGLYSSAERPINGNYQPQTPRNRTSPFAEYPKPPRESSPFSRLQKKIGHLEKEYESFSKASNDEYKSTAKASRQQEIREESWQTKRYSRQQTRKYIQTMVRIVQGEVDALTERIQQFQYRVENHVQREFNVLKKTIVESIQSIFNSVKQSFIREYQKRIIQLNTPLFTTKDQLVSLSYKLHKIKDNIEAPHWSVSVTEVDASRISEQVQLLVQKSEKLQTQKLVIQLQKQALRVLDESVREILQLDGNLRAMRDR